MPEFIMEKNRSALRGLRIVLDAILALYVFSLIFLGLAFSSEISSGFVGIGTRSHIVATLNFYFSSFLKAGVLFWILFKSEKIVRTIARKNPFDSLNPGRIRHVAGGVFSYAVIDGLSKTINIFSGIIPQDKFLTAVIGDILVTVFWGIVILLISKVFEVGVALQQDQDLTI